MYIYGDFETSKARLMNVQLIKCNNETRVEKDCLPEEDIKDFLRDKWLILFNNNIRFDSKYYNEDSVVRESYMTWIPVNTQFQQSIPYKAHRSQLFLQDKIFDLD